ncbi:GDSL esterase/lipase [Acorus calamus]|uniref:GDSL esterase/lipase n=1 Tax=Acorus calamus TaxID=4465 RepID=A0AAV9FUT8_ACOCL|nr:GDSL esterase/lipase [Acorus calamus]
MFPAMAYTLLSLSLLLASTISVTKAQTTPINGSASALLVFGDSTVDAGNNNYLFTTFKGNFPPYGRDFKGHRPTGRFTNGRLGSDFVASYLGLKDDVPAYLDPTLSLEDLLTGVSFASAGTGLDTLTAQINDVIPVSTQLDYFREYIDRIGAAIGRREAEEHIRRAIVFISIGTNDFIVNYLALPFRKQTFTVGQYQDFLLMKQGEFLQGLRSLGVRRVAVVGLTPFGCIPLVITLNSNGSGENIIDDRRCVESYNALSRDYNHKLQRALSVQHQRFAQLGGGLVFMDVYQATYDIFNHPAKFGFEESRRGCCGTGLVEGAFLCNPTTPVCPDASKFVFFDSVHGTEKVYYLTFIYSLRGPIDRLLRG